MYSPPAWSNRARAAEVLAICIRLRAPSCILAPPDMHTITSGSELRVASSMSRAIFSPSTEPIEPIRKSPSITPSATRRPLMYAMPVRTASVLPVLACSARSRSA